MRQGAEHGAWGRVWEAARRVRAPIARGLDLIFPPEPLDGGPRPQTTGLSVEGWSRARFLEAPVCDGCGAPFEYDQGPGVRCAPCQTRPPVVDRVRAACVYDDPVRALILGFKHADRVELAPMFARWIGRAARELIEDAEAIAPVPLHRSRLIVRRYNQAAEIARPLARRFDRQYLADALVRVRDTGHQGGRSGTGRRRNVEGAFAVPADRLRFVRGRRVLLIDDVTTTGATLDACARALKKAGARAVDAAVVARVQRD